MSFKQDVRGAVRVQAMICMPAREIIGSMKSKRVTRRRSRNSKSKSNHRNKKRPPK